MHAGSVIEAVRAPERGEDEALDQFAGGGKTGTVRAMAGGAALFENLTAVFQIRSAIRSLERGGLVDFLL